MYVNGMQQRHRVFPLNENLTAQLFIIQSKRLISKMSLKNIRLENCAYETLQTQFHDLFRTSIQDPTLRPPGGSRQNASHILEQGEHEGEEGF